MYDAHTRQKGAEFEFKFMHLATLVLVDDIPKYVYYLQLRLLSLKNIMFYIFVSSGTRCLSIWLFFRLMLINVIFERFLTKVFL